MILPNFLICGAPKAGTTSLYEYLREHPDVRMSEPKETGFFFESYERGIAWFSKNHFANYDGEAAVGEASAGNMLHEEVPGRIAEHVPDAKLIFVLRDPVERIYSHHNFDINIGTAPLQKTFSERVREDSEWSEIMVELGMYHEQLLRYEEHFDASQMKIILYERFCDEQKQVLREVYEFIGVDPSFEPDTSTRHNVTRYPKSRTLHRLAYALWEPVEKRLGDAVLEKTRWLRSAVRNRLFQSGTDQEKPPMKPADRAYLRDIYREPNARLAEYLDRDLSHWT